MSPNHHEEESDGQPDRQLDRGDRCPARGAATGQSGERARRRAEAHDRAGVLAMLAVFASELDPDDPLRGLNVGERPDPDPPDGWPVVSVKAASLNHHDLWSLRGVGLSADRLPMILGCDAAGLDEEGNEVVIHSVISDPDWRNDETFDPKRSLLSERYQGALA